MRYFLLFICLLSFNSFAQMRISKVSEINGDRELIASHYEGRTIFDIKHNGALSRLNEYDYILIDTPTKLYPKIQPDFRQVMAQYKFTRLMSGRNSKAMSIIFDELVSAINNL